MGGSRAWHLPEISRRGIPSPPPWLHAPLRRERVREPRHDLSEEDSCSYRGRRASEKARTPMTVRGLPCGQGIDQGMTNPTSILPREALEYGQI